ncbi:MAG: hypothetical protein COA78_01155 [Blastopirellula sp.]|nr:MAG: hypothetical protein COA78_01155 [Blastopirellula sp.]
MINIKIVDDDTFLLALDVFFREGMKQIESSELLVCAESISRELSLDPSTCPIEGYYHETPELSQYFRLMRSIQEVEKNREREISDTRSFERLKQVSSSSIFGICDDRDDLLLPRRRDVVAYALLDLAPEWKLQEVLERARDVSSPDDYSLVGMACRFGSPYVVAALRETVALYAAMMPGCAWEIEYRWEVSSELETLANQFIEAASIDIGFEIPKANSENAPHYFEKGTGSDILGRCIAIGYNDAESPQLYYHWAIRLILADGKPDVEEFWDEQLWTTERYSVERHRIYSESIDTTRPLCKRDGCDRHSVKLSLFCKKHHLLMLMCTNNT